jgi:hypothetical protein
MSSTIVPPPMGKMATEFLKFLNNYVQQNKWKGYAAIHYGKGLVRFWWQVPLMIIAIIVLIVLTIIYRDYSLVRWGGSLLIIYLTIESILLIIGKAVPLVWGVTKPLENVTRNIMKFEDETGVDPIIILEQLAAGVDSGVKEFTKQE